MGLVGVHRRHTNYAVKRIVVKPGARLSLQRHAFRAEHWVVVGGIGLVTRGTETFPVASGEHAAIGLGDVTHREPRPG